jgi:flagellar biosynthesis protein FliR
MVLGIPFGETLANVPRAIVAVGITCALLNLVEPGAVSVLILPIEFVLGYAVTAPIRIAIDASQMFGELLDTARGQTIGSVVDPLGTGAPSDLAGVARMAALVWTLQIGGLEAIVRILSEWLAVYPPGGGAPGLAHTLVALEVRALATVAGGALRLSLVWCTGYLMIEILCAFCGQVMGRVSCGTLGQLLKMLFTYVLLLLLVGDILVSPAAWITWWAVG